MKKILSIILFVVFVGSTSTMAFAQSSLLNLSTVVIYENVDASAYGLNNPTNAETMAPASVKAPKATLNIKDLLVKGYYAK